MSGAALIGKMPSHWSVKPLRLIGRLLKGTGGSKVDVVEDGVPCVSYGDIYTTRNNFTERARTYLTEKRPQDYTPIEYGDVPFAASGETIEEVGKSAVNLLHGARCGGDVVILRPTEPAAARFLGYATDAVPAAGQKSLAGRGTTFKHAYPDELREVVVAIPPLNEQQAIADYFDRETARIDSLIAAKERVLGFLVEKRRALIARAVTHGLDAKVMIRDCGVPWLGEIPEHWSLKRLKFAARVQTGIAIGKDYGRQATTEFPYVRVANGQDGFIDFSEVKTVAVPECETAFATLRRGDVLIYEGGDADKLGRGAIWDGSITPCLHQNHVFALRPMLVMSEWLLTWTGSVFAKAYFETRAKQSTNLASIASTNLLELPIVVPPDGEQRSIVDHIAGATAKIDAVRATTERTVALLRERRAALIAAAVTGHVAVVTPGGTTESNVASAELDSTNEVAINCRQGG